MDSRKKRVARHIAISGVTVTLGLMIWALIAFAAAQVQTYSDATYTVVKTKFGRGIDPVYSRMTNGFNGATYYAEQYGSVWESYTSVPPVEYYPGSRSSAKVADATGNCTDVFNTAGSENAGMWQVRYFHNPQYSSVGHIIIDSPNPTSTLQAASRITGGGHDSFKFHLEDRDGNLITTDLSANMSVLIKDGATVVWRNKAPSGTPKKKAAGWTFSGGYYQYVTENDDGNQPYLCTADDNVLQFEISYSLGTESGDTYAMGSLVCDRYWKVGASPTPDSLPYEVSPVESMNPHFVGNPAGTTYAYTYYFDILDYAFNNISTGTYTWARTAVEAMDYDQDTLQTSVTGTNPTYDASVGHWKSTITLNAPGKYLFKFGATATNSPECDDIIHFGATRQYEMAGDVTPPAEVTWGNYSGVDNVVGMDWTNPGDADFNGVIILRNTVSIPAGDKPSQGVVYDPTGSGGPATINTSRVVYYSNGTSYSDGDPCLPAQRLANGTTYYYKAYTFDDSLNYSTGVQINATPTDAVLPGTVTGVGFIEGDKENTVTWTNPSDCDFDGVTIRFRSDGTFPSSRTGADGSTLAGTKTGGTPGAADSFIHSNRTNGTPYYYSVWTQDDDGNWNDTPMSPATYAVPHDVTPPNQINDLAVTGGTTAFDITVQWTSPGDDGTTGQAKEYDIRFYDQPIDSGNWDDAWLAVGEAFPDPQPYGTTQSYKIAGLSPLSQYYFAIKAADESGNEGPVSNSPADTTLCNEELSDCNQCHLMPPHDALPGSHPRATGNVGSHDLPIHASANAAQCNVCHANGDVFDEISSILHYDFNHQNDQIDMNNVSTIGNLAERENKTGGTFFLETTIVYKYKNYSSGVGYKQLTGYCQNTYCHGAGLSSPKWGLGTVVCGEFCHETPPATGRHVKHYHPGQYYINMAPAGVIMSGYDNYSGSGWSGSPTLVSRSGANADLRYDTFIQSSNSQKTFILPDGTWYITVCVGDPNGAVTGQHIEISGNGGVTWDPLIDNFDTQSQKLFKKVVDHEFIVSGGNNLIVKIGNGTDVTDLNFMIVNATPEAPKSNTTLLQNTPSKYGFACGKCHVDDVSQSRHTEHVYGAFQEGVRDAEVYFDGNAFPKNPLGVYTTVGLDNISTYTDGQGFDYTTGRSCVNTYCHGNTLNAGGTNTTPTWHNSFIDVEGASLCGACHDSGYADSSVLTNITTGSHDKHVDIKYGYEFDCYKCHYHTVGPKDPGDGDKIAIVDKTHHVNGDVDLEFDPNDNSMKFGHYSTTTKTCVEVYCHSNGLLTPAGEPAPYTKYAEPVWNSGSKPCDYCHGTSRADGMPDYFNSDTTQNSHVKHVDENNQGCSTCHNDTTRDDGVSIYTGIKPVLHVDGGPNVTFSALNAGATYNEGNLQCSDTYCHGLTAPPTWGGVATCGSCHGDGVDNPNPGIGAHDMHNNGNYGNISSASANASTQTNYDFDCRFCHFQRIHGAGPDNPGVRAAEVNFNTIDVNSGYNNAGGTFFEGSTTFTDAGGWNFTNSQCDVMCHSDGLGGAPNNTTYKWTAASGSLGCNGCHNAGAVAPVGQRMDSHNHSKHVWADVYRKSCQDCHEPTVTGSNTITDRSKHVNANADVGISVVWGGSYNQSDMTCDSNQCHWNGDPFWNGTGLEVVHYTMMNWTTTALSDCETCHSDTYHPSGDGARTAKQTLSKHHAKHVNMANNTSIPGYGERFGCTMCHNSTALNNTTLQSTVPTTHNNQQKDVVYNTDFMYNMTGLNCADPRTGYWGTWNTPVPGNCTVICHSRWGFVDVTSVSKTNVDPIKFPNWSSVDYGCGGCHGDRFGNLTSGSHETHLAPAGQNIDCGACHSGTARNDYPNNDGQQEISLAGYTSLHLNNFSSAYVEVALAPYFSGSTGVGGSWNSGSRTCTTSNSACHDSGSPIWGTAASCSDCHVVTGAETVDTNYTYNNGTKSTINFQEYTAIGHGRNTGSYQYSGNTGASNASKGARQITGCENNECHDGSVPHGDTATPNFFRLHYNNVDDVCTTVCHTSGQVGHHTQANTNGDGDWSFTPKCVDCHDPHGDKNVEFGRYNYYMIQGYVNFTTASTSDGRPGAATKSVSFPANNTLPGSLDRDSYAQSDYSGLCQICHTGGGNPANFSKSLYNTGHSGTAACSDCHAHSSGFKGAGDCMGCHGTGGAGTGAGLENIELAFQKTSHHVNGAWSSFVGEECYPCHYEANTDGSMSSDHDKNGTVKLRQWTAAYGNEGSMTAVNYTIGTSNTNVINNMCEGCHNATNASATPFDTANGVSDTGTPGMYDTASGGASAGSVSARWSDTTTTPFSKFNPNYFNVVPQITKAYSPHGNAGNNQRGVVLSGAWSDDTGATEVGCIDCHNAHGSDALANDGSSFTAINYSSVVGGYRGALLRETSTYEPDETSVYAASTDLCWDCHLGDDSSALVNYTSYGYSHTIDGYYDAGRWGSGDHWQPTFAYKTGQSDSGKGDGNQKGGHFGASTYDNMSTTPTGQINGKCTACHDPHGIAASASNRNYMVPALKGTWLTSPYKEDRTATVSGVDDPNVFGNMFNNDASVTVQNNPSRFTPRFDYCNPALIGAGFGTGVASTNWGTGGSGAYGYFIDDNTFGTTVTNDSNGDGTITDNTTSSRITNATAYNIGSGSTGMPASGDMVVGVFGGLCLGCHASADLQGVRSNNGTNTVYPHKAVRGWGGSMTDIFKQVQANNHMMAYIGDNANNRVDCNYNWAPQSTPAGYRWSVNPGTSPLTLSAGGSPNKSIANPTSGGQATSGTYVQNNFHNFPCSKCHTAHTSKLPKLMKTNCLDVGTSTTAPKMAAAARANSGYAYPVCDTVSGAYNNATNRSYMMECHNTRKSNTAGGGGWNTVTGW